MNLSPRKSRPRKAATGLMPGSPGSLDDRLAREALLDLAYDASSYLRRHAQSAVRVSAALLIAASLASCGSSATAIPSSSSVVQPLGQEVMVGLPTSPGRYPVVLNTLGRDARGVYYFNWQRPNDPAGQTAARVSRLRLAQVGAVGTAPTLEIPPRGDPILYLPPNVAIPLIASADDLRSSSSYHGSYWRPFYGSSYAGPGYYDPTIRTVPSSGSTIDGARVSSSLAPPAERTIGVRGAVSARAGGAGSGTAATNKSGAFAASMSHGGAAAAKAGGFSAGRGGSSGGSSSS